MTDERTPGRVGESVRRADAAAKARGSFAFAPDLEVPRMLWAALVRTAHPAARIRGVSVERARSIPGFVDAITAADVPGRPDFGLMTSDQPVFARDVVRYMGEPIVAVVAETRSAARRAARAVEVDYQILEPVVDPALAAGASPIHPDGNVVRELRIVHGDPEAVSDVVVEGEYEVGMPDAAFLAPEAGLALADSDGGVSLRVATQWVHADRAQIADCLGLPVDKVRVELAGVGGAFGGREDLSVHIPACLLALRTGRPVKLLFDGRESFLGHVHRHPASMRYRHHARADGTLVKVECSILLDGGAYASSSSTVLLNAVTFATGPYRVPNAVINGVVVRTNNPPCGAMRGFGAVQVCFGYEAQMDRLAAALGMDPLDLRLHNALKPGDTLVTGQRVGGVAPVARIVEELAALPAPVSSTDDTAHIRRGVGYALGYKNLMFSEGAEDTSTATCTLADGRLTVAVAAAEVGQGFATIAAQIARSVLGVDDVVLETVSTALAPAGGTSASRQTWMSGGAVEQACRAIGARRAAAGPGAVLTETATARHAPTTPLDGRGQGDPHVAFAFVGHRAVVEVDVELGTVRVVEMATAQDVGRALNPLHVIGQIEGGTCQGVGLALMEELVVEGGHVRNGSLRGYLVPTAADMPEVGIRLIEEPDPAGPFGAKGVGEPPAISSTAAVAAAIRNATGRPVTRVPVQPHHIARPTA